MQPVSRRLMTICAVAGTFFFFSTLVAMAQGDIRQHLAAVYGAADFNKIEKIRYTFNVKVGDKQVSRQWVWEPGNDRVTFIAGGQQKTVVYSRKALRSAGDEKLKKIDARFINDNYWLLFPLHLCWDRQLKLEDSGVRPLPIGSGKARRIVVTYPSAGGYTPGDVYELFVNGNYRITQWIYRRGGAQKPSRITTWEGYRQFGPLTVSLDHRSEDGKFRVYFTHVAVKLTGSDQWLEGR